MEWNKVWDTKKTNYDAHKVNIVWMFWSTMIYFFYQCYSNKSNQNNTIVIWHNIVYSINTNDIILFKPMHLKQQYGDST